MAEPFLRYAELTKALENLAGRRPDLVELSSIGRSFEGREILVAEVTNAATAPAADKPALWVDGNIHGAEVVSSAAALHLIERLVDGHGADPTVTRALDTRAFYVAPRLNPDGAEWALADVPRFVRSSTRPWPRTEQGEGLVPGDVDGDGRVLTMRVPDPNGAWKVAAEDARLMVPRDPDEDGGAYYRLLPEGRIEGFDGVTIPVPPPRYGLDLNRNFPASWRPRSEQPTAGDFPASEPEVRATVEAVLGRPNICAYLAYHSMGGLHLRPYGDRPDDRMPLADLRTYEEIGRHATARTGYPAVSVYDGFRYDPRAVTTGMAQDWAYDHLGLLAWTTELWSPPRAAGIATDDLLGWFRHHPVADDVAMLAWNDRELDGRGYVEWYPYDHPELGPVELGGWDDAYCIRTPPPHALDAELARNTGFAIFQALATPLLAVRSLDARPAGDDLWNVRLVVENRGWLPTNVTERALQRGAVGPVEAMLVAGDGSEVVGGPARQALGQLTGRGLARGTMAWGAADATTDRSAAEWLVRCDRGTPLSVEARHARAGVVRGQLDWSLLQP